MAGVDDIVVLDSPPPSKTTPGNGPLSPANRVTKGPLDRFLFKSKPAPLKPASKPTENHEPDVIVPDTTDCADIVSTRSDTTSSSANKNVIEETLAEAESPSGDAGESSSDSSPENSSNGKRSALGIATEKSSLNLSFQKKRRRLSLDEKRAREEEMKRKKEEREKKREERERQKLELEQAKQKRAEDRQKKLEALKEAEREKEEKKKQAEERRKQAELEKEEKRKQLEAEKEERRRQKETERQQAEEAKKRKLEEEQAKMSKAAQMFKKHFFVVQNSANKPNRTDVVEDKELAHTSYMSFGPFKMFQLRENQRLAAICRLDRLAREKAKRCLDEALAKTAEESVSICSLITEYKNGSRNYRSSQPTYPPMEDAVIRLDDHTTKTMHAKLLQFTEDIRPPYFGTWRKSSKLISARKPFGQDTRLFDYDCDSAAEWEEPEDGEDILSSSKESGDEESEAKSSDEEEDGFIVPHGYLSTDEEEAREDDELNLAPSDVKLRSRVQDSYELGCKKIAKSLRPLFFGPELVESGRPLPIDFSQFQPIFHEPTPADIEAILCGEVCTVPETVPPAATSDSDAVPNAATVSKKTGETKLHKKPVPKEGYPALIRYIHGNSAGIGRLILGFIESFAKEPVIGCEVSKRQVERQIFTIAERVLRPERHPSACWYVRDDILAEHNLTDLPVPNVTHASPAIKRQRKKGSENIRDTTAATTTPKAAPAQAPSTPTIASAMALAAAKKSPRVTCNPVVPPATTAEPRQTNSQAMEL